MSEHHAEPVFCSECQNEVAIEKARVLGGKVLCPTDLAKRSFLERLRARRLPQDYSRRSGRVFQSMMTSMAALILVLGIGFIIRALLAMGNIPEGQKWPVEALLPGLLMILASALVAIAGMFAGDVIDLLMDIRDQQQRR